MVQALCCGHVAFSRNCHVSRGSQPLRDCSLEWEVSALPPQSPCSGQVALAPSLQQAITEPVKSGGGGGGGLPAAWPPRLDPFPASLPQYMIQLQDDPRATQYNDETQAGAPKGRLGFRGPWHGWTAWPGALPACSFLPLVLSSLFTARHSPLSVTSSWTQASVSWQVGTEPNSFLISLIPGVL